MRQIIHLVLIQIFEAVFADRCFQQLEVFLDFPANLFSFWSLRHFQFSKANNSVDQTLSYMLPLTSGGLVLFSRKLFEDQVLWCRLLASDLAAVWPSYPGMCPAVLPSQWVSAVFATGRGRAAGAPLFRINGLLWVTATILQSAKSVCLLEVRGSLEKPVLSAGCSRAFHSLSERLWRRERSGEGWKHRLINREKQGRCGRCWTPCDVWLALSLLVTGFWAASSGLHVKIVSIHSISGIL